jgi:hypothetical protein
MSKAGSVWQRLGGFFRTNDAAPRRTADVVVAPDMPKSRLSPGLGHGTQAVAPSAAIEGSRDDRSARPARLATVTEPARASWWQRRQVRQLQVREASRRVVQLADALERYFQRQDERSAELTNSLVHVGGVLDRLADTQSAQGERLRDIAQHTETAVKQAGMLADTLGRLPDSLVTQAEALRAVARQIEVGQESDTQLMHSLQQFGRAVDTLGTAGTSQVEVLQRLNAAQREQQQALMTLVHEQSRRFMLMLIVGTVLAIAALAALGVTLALQWAR